jgi:cell pole-organizing protein PopZ
MMSLSSSDISNSGGPGSAAEPSMEEILASIRRILKEDDAALGSSGEADKDFLLLDESMIVKHADLGSATFLPEAPPAEVEYPAAPLESYATQFHVSSEPAPFAQDYGEDIPLEPEAPAQNVYMSTQEEPQHGEPETPAILPMESEMSEPDETNVHPPHGIIGAAAADAAASSVGALVRSISQEKSIAISRGGISIEDIVREEIRPLLKSWLDTHLPSLVERVVRGEIERLVERSGV